MRWVPAPKLNESVRSHPGKYWLGAHGPPSSAERRTGFGDGLVVDGGAGVGGAEVVGMVVARGNVVVDSVVVVTAIVVDACSAGAVDDAKADVSVGAVVINDCSRDPPHAATSANDSAANAFPVLTSEQSA